MKIKYYLINGVDRTRDEFMKKEFDKVNIPQDEVIWIKSHNKTELTDEFIKNISTNPPRGFKQIKIGQLSCTYKHYLALKHIVENNIDIGVIMEDNIEFKCDLSNDFPKILNEYLELIPEDWDLLFESDTLNYKNIEEDSIISNKKIYKKKNEITKYCNGATNGANCYIIPLKTAILFYKHYLPIPITVDFHMNNLIRNHKLNVYWCYPPIVHRLRRRSTVLYENE